ncbi:hypothetical protein HK104_002329 [Borealophlyctis nickersoniae]|nr:hypothetical protein HK104_002329 [Borealophlyctis nickersoniae]
MKHESPASATPSPNSAWGGGAGRMMVEQVGRMQVVYHDYEPVMADELALRVGDVVVLKAAYDDGYGSGELTPAPASSTPRTGVFPLACLLPSGDVNEARAARLYSLTLGSPIPQPDQDTPELLLLSGRITEEAYMRLRRERREERQINAIRERLENGALDAAERERLKRRLDVLECGIGEG